MIRLLTEPAMRIGVCVSLMAVLWYRADGALVIERLTGMDLIYVAAALVITVPQVGLSAWRWHFTATRLGLHLPFAKAFQEYYLSTFLNQVLPGGVLGDAARAWRHGRTESAGLACAARAVILERTSGQIALFSIILAAAIFDKDAFFWLVSAIAPWAAVAGLAAAVVLPLVWKSKWGEHISAFVSDCRYVFSGLSGLVQLISSLCVVATYLTVYGLAAKAVGVELSTGTLMTVVPIILFSMVLPISVSGWGVRETVAVTFAAASGLTPNAALTVSVAYGLIVLVSSLPGLLMLVASRGDEDTLATSGR